MSKDIEILKAMRFNIFEETKVLKNQLINIQITDPKFKKDIHQIKFNIREIEIYDIIINNAEGC